MLNFKLGTIVATPGALDVLEKNGEDPFSFLRRHAAGDWGIVGEEDAKTNEKSVKYGMRILSAYLLKDGTKIWIITEADRSVTTILLPEEY